MVCHAVGSARFCVGGFGSKNKNKLNSNGNTAAVAVASKQAS